MSNKKDVSPLLKSILNYDINVTRQFVKLIDTKFGPLTNYKGLFKGLEISCHGIPWLALTAALVFLISESGFRNLCVNLFIAILIDIAVVAVIKASTRRRRPMGNTKDMFATYAMDKFSFPSGHASRAVMFAFLIPNQYELYFPLYWLLLSWSACLCCSRVLMKRHYILDVAGGFVVGWLEAAFIGQFIWLSISSTDGLVKSFL